MTIPVVDSTTYVEKLRQAWRPGGEKVLAFYEHRVGVICKDSKLMLMLWDDHLVHRGDAVFETMKWVDRKMYQLDAHLKRMERSGSAIFLAPPCSLEEVREITMEVARAAGTDLGLVRILLGRGPGGFGIDPTECPVPSMYVVAYAFKPKPETYWSEGVTTFRTGIPAKQSWIATIKSTDYLPNVLMKREALEKGYDYPLCFDAQNFLAEGATENVCLVDAAGTLVVPELTSALAGTTLMRAIELLGDELPVAFRKVGEGEIYNAREVIILGTTGDAVAAVRYNGKPIHDVKPGPVARRMRELLQADLRENGEPL
jgi:branched-chain amino acid aminotransferase